MSLTVCSHLFAASFLVLLVCSLTPVEEATRACNACGPECVTACGTAMFRACCFNYNRKRSGPGAASELRDAATPGGGALDTAEGFETRSEPSEGASPIRQDAWALFWMLPQRARTAAQSALF